MIFVLSRKFEKLFATGWISVLLIIYLFFWSDQVLTLELWEATGLSMLAFAIYLSFALSTIQIKLNGYEEIEYYWVVLGLRMGSSYIPKSEVDELIIEVLPSQYFALKLTLKNRRGFVLLKGKNRKKLNKGLTYYNVSLSEKPFFQNLKINSHPFEQYSTNHELFKEAPVSTEDQE